ncbi:MAG: putative bifunctional diguanylate cyclase/phosphodiesterase [Terracidiphilus sp.]
MQRHLVGYETAYKQLTEAEGTFRSLFEDAPIGIFQALPDGQLVRVNSEMARILGYESAKEYLAEASKDEGLRFFDPSQWNESEFTGGEGEAGSSVDLQVRSRSGSVKWLRINSRAVRAAGEVVRFDGTVEDVTARKHVEIRTELLAYYDLLTGLPNRTLFHDKFNQVVSDLRQTGGQTALLLIEFDRFRTINDSLGDQIGDRLLQEIAERIRAGAGENGIVARLGGAEFCVLMSRCHTLADVAGAAERIFDKLSAEYSLLGHALSMFCSMGISVFPKNGEDYETLLKKADVAKCCAMEDGANRFRFFNDEMNREIQARLKMESGLRQALARKELYLEYQPQVDIRTGAVAGLEALLRWKSPELGLVPPSRFIGIAENSSLIVPIGEWVLRSACKQAKSWQEGGLPAVPVAVNVSPVQFRQQGFCELVRRTLRESGLKPEYLELELTESLLLTNADLTASIMAELRTMGVTLTIDDFGTGYSSLGYLNQFKVHRLKIDQSFVRDVSTDPDDAAITIAIIKMAKAMNLSVLAEGVETEDQLLFLRAQNCPMIQGFYFSRPVPVDEVDRHLRAGFGNMLPVEAA